jgi:hypothetical protein
MNRYQNNNNTLIINLLKLPIELVDIIEQWDVSNVTNMEKMFNKKNKNK